MSQYADDSREISERANEEVETILSEYWPGWIIGTQKGQQVALVTPRIKGKSKRPSSSFVVHLQRDRGKWFRFSAGIGGYGMQLVAYGLMGRLAESKEDWKEVYAEARRLFGMEQRQELTPEQKAEREARRRQEQADREARAAEEARKTAEARAERTLDAKEVWQESLPLIGSLGDIYLQSRGLPPVSEWPWDCKETLRFHPSLDYERDRKAGRWPAIVCRVQDAFGTGIAVWQIYISRDGAGKAPLENAKVGRGPAAGGAVRLGGEAPEIGTAEGLETSAGAWFLIGCQKPVWACLSTSGLINFELPMFVKREEIFPDGDKARLHHRADGVFSISDRPGMSAAMKAVERRAPVLGQQNISIAQEPTAGRDYLDIYCDLKAKGLV